MIKKNYANKAFFLKKIQKEKTEALTKHTSDKSLDQLLIHPVLYRMNVRSTLQ